MSLVERALKKLQESRGTPAMPHPTAAAPRPAAAAVVRETVVPERRPPPLPATAQFEIPRRMVNIDKNALRAMELLPPADAARQIESEYQHIKRPLVAAALGKSTNPVPNGHLIMLASALPGEGKTFTSINLALSMALEKDIDVLLVDADVAKPHVTSVFGLQEERGLMDLLSDSALHPESVILRTNVPGLNLLPAGRRIDNATELLASERMEQIAAQLGVSGARRMVIFDSPPLLLSTESRAMVPMVGQVVLVVRADVTSQKAVMDAIDMVGDAKPVSLILNQSNEPHHGAYYGYGPYGHAEAESARSP